MLPPVLKVNRFLVVDIATCCHPVLLCDFVLNESGVVAVFRDACISGCRSGFGVEFGVGFCADFGATFDVVAGLMLALPLVLAKIERPLNSHCWTGRAGVCVFTKYARVLCCLKSK